MKRGLFTHNNKGIDTAICPKCGQVMESKVISNGCNKPDIGYVCKCGYQEWESDYQKVRV